MSLFPIDINDVLSVTGARKIATYSSTYGSLKDSGSFMAWIPSVMTSAQVDEFTDLLNGSFAPYLTKSDTSIPPGLIKQLKRNHTEALPHIRLQSTILFEPADRRAREESDRSGFDSFCKSEDIHRIAEDISGFSLKRRSNYQLIAYDNGDYVGPHNDHHPEDPTLVNGYVDVQLTLSTRGVDSQYVLWEEHGHLNQQVNVGVRSGLAVCHLPYWHQVTPLRLVGRHRPPGRRWLIAVTFEKRKSGPSS